MKEPDVLTRMRLCECWGDSLNVEELKEVNDYIEELQQENQELKEQLEEINNFINKASFVNIEQLMLDYCAKVEQQKEFIEYLESEMILFQEYMKEIECSDRCHGDYPITYWSSKYKLNEVAEILSKYKEIIGVKDE